MGNVLFPFIVDMLFQYCFCCCCSCLILNGFGHPTGCGLLLSTLFFDLSIHSNWSLQIESCFN